MKNKKIERLQSVEEELRVSLFELEVPHVKQKYLIGQCILISLHKYYELSKYFL
jgi:hypothetical protein